MRVRETGHRDGNRTVQSRKNRVQTAEMNEQRILKRIPLTEGWETHKTYMRGLGYFQREEN
jgi:hypothetical protein